MFDPEIYAANIRKRNAEEIEAIKKRLALAKEEARMLSQKIYAQDSNVKTIYLFGSVATERVSSIDFDIDLAIEGGDIYKAMDMVESSNFKVDLVDFKKLPNRTQNLIKSTGTIIPKSYKHEHNKHE